MSQKKPTIMGILNLTPDSFSDGGLFLDTDLALFQAEKLISEGADILDIGAESSRPGASYVSADEEKRRLEPFLSVYKQRFDTPLSLDTYKPEVAEMGLSYGVSYINDITGLQGDVGMAPMIAKFGAGVIVMHMQKKPHSMQDNPVYTDVIREVKQFLAKSLSLATLAGIETVIVDPGIGFGKTLTHNLMLLNHLESFLELECPILIGTSRKSFIGQLTGEPVSERLEGTLVSNLIALEKGASIFRVHDVAALKKTFTVYYAIKDSNV